MMPEFDEGILLQLLHESFQQEDESAGVAHLDELLKRYLVDQRIEQTKHTLEQLVKNYPDFPELRKCYIAFMGRLSNTYRLVEHYTIIAQQKDDH